MSAILKDVFSELKSFIKGSTLDALLPPLLFMIVNSYSTLLLAIVISLGAAMGLFVYRVFKKDRWYYAVAGLLGVAIATGFAYLAGNAKDYFLPDLISGLFFFVLSLITLILNKPLAAWVSHLTRGWTIDWFWRADIKPAYLEVTIFWTIFLLIRLVLLTIVYVNGNSWLLFLSNIVLGFPATILVLTISYIYGIWRLKNLKGPGIDEFNAQISPPWKGQRKGF